MSPSALHVIACCCTCRYPCILWHNLSHPSSPVATWSRAEGKRADADAEILVIVQVSRLPRLLSIHLPIMPLHRRVWVSASSSLGVCIVESGCVSATGSAVVCHHVTAATTFIHQALNMTRHVLSYVNLLDVIDSTLLVQIDPAPALRTHTHTHAHGSSVALGYTCWQPCV